jgi:hypothetical protein
VGLDHYTDWITVSKLSKPFWSNSISLIGAQLIRHRSPQLLLLSRIQIQQQLLLSQILQLQHLSQILQLQHPSQHSHSLLVTIADSVRNVNPLGPEMVNGSRIQHVRSALRVDTNIGPVMYKEAAHAPQMLNRTSLKYAFIAMNAMSV